MSVDPQTLETVLVQVGGSGSGGRRTSAKCKGPNFQFPAVWLCDLGICRGCWPDLGAARIDY